MATAPSKVYTEIAAVMFDKTASSANGPQSHGCLGNLGKIILISFVVSMFLFALAFCCGGLGDYGSYETEKSIVPVNTAPETNPPIPSAKPLVQQSSTNVTSDGPVQRQEVATAPPTTHSPTKQGTLPTAPKEGAVPVLDSDIKDMITSSMAYEPAVQETRITQKHTYLFLYVLVDENTTKHSALRIAENFVRRTKTLSADDSPRKIIGTGIYTYIVTVQIGQRGSRLKAAKYRNSTELKWQDTR